MKIYNEDKTKYYEDYIVGGTLSGRKNYQARFIHKADDNRMINVEIRNLEAHEDRYAIDITTQDVYEYNGEHKIQVLVQTTSWGALDTGTMRKVIKNYQDAISVVEMIEEELKRRGVQVVA